MSYCRFCKSEIIGECRYLFVPKSHGFDERKSLICDNCIVSIGKEKKKSNNWIQLIGENSEVYYFNKNNIMLLKISPEGDNRGICIEYVTENIVETFFCSESISIILKKLEDV